MTNIVQQPTQHPVKGLFQKEEVQQKFREILGKRATAFITSVLQISAQNSLLAQADPVSIYQSALVAATLDLPLNNNLGFAYIVPYNQSYKENGVWKKKAVAQFQMGYKGFIQLAQRSGQFKSIYAAPIFEGQIVNEDPLNGYEFDFTKKSDVLVGYAAKFKLLNGYEATLYMTKQELLNHGKKYSQTFKDDRGVWKDNFDAMAQKTVLKLLLSKFAPLSVEMQKAVVTDQSVINDAETIDVSYVDNDVEVVDKEAERVAFMIQDATSAEELETLRPHVRPEQQDLFNQKLQEVSA